MIYIRFLNVKTPLQDVEKMYKDGAIKYGDIVCQQYNDKSSHLFMNGTWIKTLYNSKIKQNNEIEDDIEFLSTAIGNNSTNIGEVSTRLKDDYVNKTQYLKDEELICSKFAELNNKINTNANIVNASITQLADNIQNINFDSLKTEISNTYATKQQVNTIGNTIWNKVKETYVSSEKYNNDIETINNKISTYYTNDQIDTFVGNLNTSIKDTSDNLNIVSGKVDEVSTRLDNTSVRLNNVSTRLKEVSVNLNNTIISVSSNLKDTSTRLNDVSSRLNDVSTRLNDTSVRLLNYLTINQYLKDEELIASTFADVNNKINSLYAEIAELKEQLKSSTK